MKKLSEKKYTNGYKFDKLADYFKFLITIQLATIGFILTVIDKKFIISKYEWLFPFALFFIIASLITALFGKTFLLKALFEEKSVSDKLIFNCAYLSLSVFIGVIILVIVKIL